MVVTKQALSEAYLSLTQSWGMTLVFSVTQSLELSEKTVAEAVVALIATEVKSEAKRLTSTERAELFAKTLCEMALPLAFRGFTTESFYRMTPVARAAVILKVRAGFSMPRLSKILALTESRVEEFLENARLLFSSGSPWVESGVELSGAGHFSPAREDLQDTFAKYLGADLDADESRKLQDHLMDCDGCRKNFSYFKHRYSEWQSSLPQISLEADQQKKLKKISKMAFAADRSIPNPWAGMRAVMRENQVRAFLLSCLFFALLFQFLFGRH